MLVTPAVQELFKNVSIPEIERFLSQKRLEVQQRKRELKDTMTTKYREVLECADTLSSLHSIAVAASDDFRCFTRAQQIIRAVVPTQTTCSDFRFTSFLSADEEARLLALEGHFVRAASLAKNNLPEILKLAEAALEKISDSDHCVLLDACVALKKVGNFSIENFKQRLVASRLDAISSENYSALQSIKIFESLQAIAHILGFTVENSSKYLEICSRKFASTLDCEAWEDRVYRTISDLHSWRAANEISDCVPVEAVVRTRKSEIARAALAVSFAEFGQTIFAAISDLPTHALIEAVSTASESIETSEVDELLAGLVEQLRASSEQVKMQTIVACQFTTLCEKFPDFKAVLQARTVDAFRRSALDFFGAHDLEKSEIPSQTGAHSPAVGNLLLIASSLLASMAPNFRTSEALKGVRAAINEVRVLVARTSLDEELLDFFVQENQSEIPSNIRGFLVSRFFLVLPLLDSRVTLKNLLAIGPVPEAPVTDTQSLQLPRRKTDSKPAQHLAVPVLQGLLNK